MSTRDKYHQDHTISVNGGAGTLTVDGSLNCTGDLETAAIELIAPITQTYRVLGNSFLCRSTADLANITISTLGKLRFTTASTTLHAPVTGLPHGAVLKSLRIRGVAEAIGDILTVTLIRSTGSSSSDLATISLTNAGTETIDQSAVVDNYVIDYSTNSSIFISALGDESAGEVALDLVDVTYQISNFPQNSAVTPI